MSFSNKELFTGTAECYSKYRIKYPNRFLDIILKFYEVDGKGNLLDLGCGTGQLAIPLHKDFKEVVAIDISEDMINVAKRNSLEKSAHNITFKIMESEKIDKELGKFNLILCGNAFHWMDKKIVLDKSYDILTSEGGMAILGGGSVWTGKAHWQKEIVKIIKKWLGEKRKAGKGDYPTKHRSYDDYISESQFRLIKKGVYKFNHSWNIESLIGYLYSTSFCNRSLFGDNIDAFENELKETLININPIGIFEEEVQINYFFLKK